jgi:hypothetical protein
MPRRTSYDDPYRPTDADLDEIDRYAGVCRVTADPPGPDAILLTDLTAEIRRLRREAHRDGLLADAVLRELDDESPVTTPAVVPAEDKLVDLMANLEDSVREARAEREAQRLRGPRLVPRRDPHLCWRIHPGTDGACQLPNDHDMDGETP